MYLFVGRQTNKNHTYSGNDVQNCLNSDTAIKLSLLLYVDILDEVKELHSSLQFQIHDTSRLGTLITVKQFQVKIYIYKSSEFQIVPFTGTSTNVIRKLIAILNPSF